MRRLPGEVAVRRVLEVAPVPGAVVHDVHVPVVVHPQLAHDDVVHRGRDLAPCVVVVGLGETQVSYACNNGTMQSVSQSLSQ